MRLLCCLRKHISKLAAAAVYPLRLDLRTKCSERKSRRGMQALPRRRCKVGAKRCKAGRELLQSCYQ